MSSPFSSFSASKPALDQPFDQTFSSPSSSEPLTPTPPPLAAFNVDYSLWTEERFREFPGFICKHSPQAERADWWKYGYRMENEARGTLFWVCACCFDRKGKSPRQYSFVATTSNNIQRHLQHKHRISV